MGVLKQPSQYSPRPADPSDNQDDRDQQRESRGFLPFHWNFSVRKTSHR